MAGIADGDARIALNLLEQSSFMVRERSDNHVTSEVVLKVAQEKTLLYDSRARSTST